jgi:hypothetical protein
MQKLITVTIDIEQLQEVNSDGFYLTEIVEINELLEEGWHIEEWQFVTDRNESKKAVILVVLNDLTSDPDLETAVYEFSGEDEEEDDEADDREEDDKEELEEEAEEREKTIAR